MNYYETLYIIHPALDAGRVKEMVLSVNNTLEKNEGTVVSLDVWGKKKLAYEIDKQKYGTYVLLQFTGDGSGNSKFNVELEHNPNVLAYLTIKIEEHKIADQALSLDEQIRGDNPSPNVQTEDRKTSPAQKDADVVADEEKAESTEADDSSSEEDADVVADEEKAESTEADDSSSEKDADVVADEEKAESTEADDSSSGEDADVVADEEKAESTEADDSSSEEDADVVADEEKTESIEADDSSSEEDADVATDETTDNKEEAEE